MKHLEYIGPKPLISEKGIDFDKNYDDKFNYLPVLLELIHALDHEYIEGKQYTFDAHPENMSSHEIYIALQKQCPDLDKMIEDIEEKTAQEIEERIERIDQNDHLELDEKTAYANNLKIMKEYLTNFSINEALFNCALKRLAEVVTKDHLDYIVVPMFQKFAYVLHQLQKILEDQKHPIDTQLDILEENGQMIAKLKVITLV